MHVIFLRITITCFAICASIFSAYGVEIRGNSVNVLNEKSSLMQYPIEYKIVEKKEIVKILKGSEASQEDRDYFITSYSLLLLPVEQNSSNTDFDFLVKIKNLSYKGVTQIHGAKNGGLIDDYINPFESLITNSLFKIKIDENGRVVGLSGYDELLKSIRDEFGNISQHSNADRQLATFEEAYFINLIEVLLSHLPVCVDKEFIDLRFLSSCPAEMGNSKRINTPYKIKEQDSQFAVMETSVSFNDKVETGILEMPLSIIHTGTLTFDYLSNQLVKSLSYTASKGKLELKDSKVIINTKNELIIEAVEQEGKNEKVPTNAALKFSGSGSITKDYILKGTERELNLSYEFFSDPDELIVYDHLKQILYNSGMQSTKEPVFINIPIAGLEKLIFKINTKSSKSQWRYEFSFK